MRLLALLHLGGQVGLQVFDLVEIDSGSHLKFELAFLTLVQFDLRYLSTEELGIKVILTKGIKLKVVVLVTLSDTTARL